MVFNWFKRLFCVFLGFGVTTPFSDGQVCGVYHLGVRARMFGHALLDCF